MTRSSEQRIRAEIAVRVFGMDAANKPFNNLAHTIEVSDSGVRLGGIVVPLKPDDIIGVQNNAEKARFRVLATAAPESQETGQVELHCLQPEKKIWGDLNALLSAASVRTLLTAPAKLDGESTSSKQERRHFTRYKCDIGAVVQAIATGERYWGRCTDISLGGCYLESWSPLPLEASLTLLLDGMEINCSVTTCHPGVGMGLRFEHVSDQPQLEALIEKISCTQTSP